MAEDREEEKKSKLSIALEEDGYTGVSKYMKAFGLGYRGATEDYLNNKEAKEKDKRVEAAKQAEKIRKQLEEGSTKIGKTVDSTASEISTIQNTIKELKAADLPLEQKLKEINAEKNKLQFQFKTAYDRVNFDAKNYNMQNDNQYDLAVQSLNMLADDMDFSQNGRVEVDGKEFIVDREIANRHTELVSAGKKSLLSVDDTGELVAKQVGQDGKFTDTVAPVAYQPIEEYTAAVENDDYIVINENTPEPVRNNLLNAGFNINDKVTKSIYNSYGKKSDKTVDTLKGTSTNIDNLMSKEEKDYYSGLGINPKNVTLNVLSDYRKQNQKTENLTNEESNIRNLLKTTDFKEKHKDKSPEDQYEIARKELKMTDKQRFARKLDNKEKAIVKQYKVEDVFELDINKIRKTARGANQLDEIAFGVLEQTHGDQATKILGEASDAIEAARKLFDAGSTYAKDLDTKDGQINFVNKIYDNLIGGYIGKELTSDEKLLASKGLSVIMNAQRSEQFGAVLPSQDIAKFNDAATSLAKASPDIVRGTIAMMEQEKSKIIAAKNKLGAKAFYLKYGEADVALDQKIGLLKDALNGKSKDNPFDDVEKPKDANSTKLKEEVLKNLTDTPVIVGDYEFSRQNGKIVKKKVK